MKKIYFIKVYQNNKFYDIIHFSSDIKMLNYVMLKYKDSHRFHDKNLSEYTIKELKNISNNINILLFDKLNSDNCVWLTYSSVL